MKKVTRICVWGGVSALIIAVIASICLAVLPQKLTNEYENTDGVTHAGTEVIDGITYETIYIPGDSDPEASEIIFNGESTVNYRYVLLGNWDLVANNVAIASVPGKNVILDLNGYKINSAGGYYLSFNSETIEYTDTSPRGGGIINVSTIGPKTKTVIVSGNGACYDVEFNPATNFDLFIRSGQLITTSTWNTDTPFANIRIILAPYMSMIGSGNSGKSRAYAPSHAYYAVSTSPMITGMYNYVYGYAWELNVAELSNLEVSTDKTYYLWGRNQDGWYESLNIVYRDGAWIKVA